MIGEMPMPMRSAIALAIAMVALAITASAASATTDRTDYDAQVNPICASANTQAKQLYESAEEELRRLDRKANKARGKKRQKLEAQSEQLFEQLPDLSLAIYYSELDRLKAIAPAPGDESLVSEWLGNRQAVLDLTAVANRIERRSERLFTKGFRGRSFRSFLKSQRKLKKLDRQANLLYQQIEPLSQKDIELGTKLGATYCVTGATGTP